MDDPRGRDARSDEPFMEPTETDPAAGPEDAETYSPPTDPVVTTDEHGDAQVLGGFGATSMDEPAVAPSQTGGPADSALEDAIRRELRRDAATADLPIEIEVIDGVAHLRGEVSDMVDGDNAAEVAGRVPGVLEVVEELDVTGL
ncbi:MAG: BON domain-containing protein [Chloroflexota bacterium]|nr:BON domain-containing protein [Chloroflexota bacterium]